MASLCLYSVCIAVLVSMCAQDTSSTSNNALTAPDLRDLIRRASKPGPQDAYRLFSQLKVDIDRRYMDVSMPNWDKATQERLKLWSDGVVPYAIDQMSYDEVLRNAIHSYFQVIQRITQVTFVPLSKLPNMKDVRYVIISNRRSLQECTPLHKLTNTGPQIVVIGYDCMGPREMAAMVLELLGIPPQHNSPDRDTFISIKMENILDDKKHLFEKVSPDAWPFKFKYDYMSISHYGPTALSKNGEPTIVVPKDSFIGQDQQFSQVDISKISYLYEQIIVEREFNRRTESCNIMFQSSENNNIK